MLDHFMKVAFERTRAEEQRADLHNMLKKLPVEDLYKLATGEVTKEAFLDDCGIKGVDGGEPKTWLDKFKGTPLFEQAVALEQESIQAEMDDLQKRQEERQMHASDSSIWDLQSQLRLKKRLLELQLAQQEVGGVEQPMAEEAPMEAAPPMPPAEGQQMPPKAPPPQKPKPVPAGPDAAAQGAGAMGGAPPSPEKTAMVKMADNMGRELARNDFRKEASERTLLAAGDAAGRVLLTFQKTALDMSAVKGLGTGAMNFLKANKGAAMGAAVGAAGGLAHGLQKDQNGQRHLMSGLAQGAAGGLAGAAAGHGVEHFGKAMAHSGGNVGEALKATGNQLKYQGQQAIGAVKGALGRPAAGIPAQTGATRMGLGNAPTVMSRPAMNTGQLAEQHMNQLGFQRPAVNGRGGSTIPGAPMKPAPTAPMNAVGPNGTLAGTPMMGG